MKKYVTPVLRVIEISADASMLTNASGKLKTDTEHEAAGGQSNLSIFDEIYNDDWSDADED